MIKEPITPGKLCKIEIHRGYSDLGTYVVGGIGLLLFVHFLTIYNSAL